MAPDNSKEVAIEDHTNDIGNGEVEAEVTTFNNEQQDAGDDSDNAGQYDVHQERNHELSFFLQKRKLVTPIL